MTDMTLSQTAGEPMLWWLFWFAASLVVYTVLTVWFYRVAKRETREPSPSAKADRNEAVRAAGQ